MAGKLLDTNAVTALQVSDPDLMAVLALQEELTISVTVLGELLYGALSSARVEANLEVIRELAATIPVLSCDSETATHYAQIRARLKQKGRPIPESDIWIAAVAMQHQLTLITRDAHFQQVEGLATEGW